MSDTTSSTRATKQRGAAKDDELWQDRRGVWHIEANVAGGRIRCSAFTTDKIKAAELRDSLKNRAWRERQLGEAPQHTWDEAVVAWVEHAELKKLRSLESTRDKLRWWHPYLTGKWLLDITRDVIDPVMVIRSKEPWQRWEGGSSRILTEATLNRYWAAISGVLYYAQERGWMGNAAVPVWKKLDEGEGRIRWLKPAEWNSLYQQLPEYPTGRMAALGLATGVRQYNVTHLEKDWIDWDASKIHYPARVMKNKKPFDCLLTKTAIALLRQQFADHATNSAEDKAWQAGKWVFTWRGEVIDNPHNTAWKKACKRAGITNFTWHDLRHTWATWHLMRGTRPEVLMRLGGWKDMKMVMRYAHIAEEFLREFVGNAEAFGQVPAIPALDEIEINPEFLVEINGVADGTRTHNTWNHNRKV